MQLLMYRPSSGAVWAGAFFASMLQSSDGPCAGQIGEAVAAPGAGQHVTGDGRDRACPACVGRGW